MIRYPDWKYDRAAFELEALRDDAISQIVQALPSGPLRLAGTSWGGRVAYATALSLLSQRRSVEFLGIFDAPTPWSSGAENRPRPLFERLLDFASKKPEERKTWLANWLAPKVVINYPLLTTLGRLARLSR